MSESPPDFEALELDDLERLGLQLLEENAARRTENAALREEILRLKGLKGRPRLKASGMDKKAAEQRKAKARRKQACRIGRRSDFTAEERAEIVLALLRREEPMSVLSKRYLIGSLMAHRVSRIPLSPCLHRRRKPGARLGAEVASSGRLTLPGRTS